MPPYLLLRRDVHGTYRSEEGDLLLILLRVILIAPGVLVHKRFRGKSKLSLKVQEGVESESNFVKKRKKRKKEVEGGEARPFIVTATVPYLLFSLPSAARSLQTISDSSSLRRTGKSVTT